MQVGVGVGEATTMGLFQNNEKLLGQRLLISLSKSLHKGYQTPKATNKELLLQYNQEELEKIAMIKVAELVKSMPTRVKHLAQTRGRQRFYNVEM